MNIERAAADSLLAGAALLAFVACIAVLDALSATLAANFSWVMVTVGGALLTAGMAMLAVRGAHTPPAPQLDPQLLVVGDANATRR